LLGIVVNSTLLKEPAGLKATIEALSSPYVDARTMRKLPKEYRYEPRGALEIAQLVTGGDSGIGRAVAVLFAREGAKVLCVDHNLASAQETVDMIAAKGGAGVAFKADVTKDADIKAMVADAHGRWGRVDILHIPDRFRRELSARADASPPERDRLLTVLMATNWNKSRAAAQLRWSRMTLYRKMAKYQLEREL